jgi:radical SAM protein with 4Fe4S-binding SPASM domain
MLTNQRLTKLLQVRKGLDFILRFSKNYLDTRYQTPPAVPEMSIETTNICNAKCVFCANPIMMRRKEPLEMSKFKKALDEFVAMGGTVLDFNVTIGDPLLDRSLLERARYVKQFPQIETLGFVTTLQWLHKWDMDEFFDSGLTWVSVSTALSGREKYLEFFGVDKYDQHLKNLIVLIEENKKRGNKMAIIITLKPTNEPIEDVINHPDFKMIDSMIEKDLVAIAKSGGFYVDDWLGTVKLPPYLKKRPLYPRAYHPCRLLYKGLMVYSNGNVGACSCRDFEANSELILGNVEDQTLEEMWHGEQLTQIRSNWRKKNKVPEICKSCRHYVY